MSSVRSSSVKSVIAHRLRGQDGCGQGRGLNAHAGQDRDGRRQGRPGEPARSWIAATLGMGLRIVFSNFLKMTFRGGCSNCGFPKRFFRDRNKRGGLFHTAHGKSR